MPEKFNICAVVQAGRLQYEAVLLAASLRRVDPKQKLPLYLLEPQPGDNWPRDPRIDDADVRELLVSLGAQIVPFSSEHFGASYPYGNKIEGLQALPKGEAFVFFDTDTLFLDDPASVAFDFDRPSASMKRTGTWPEIELYGPGYTAIWKSLYDRFGLEFETSLDMTWPDEYWQRYLYFNAGWFFGRCPQEFGALFTRYAVEIRDNPPDEIACQSLDPWLDQVTLPLVIHGLGGGRPDASLAGLDGDISCHWRVLPLLYARESDRVIEVLNEIAAPNKIKKVIKKYDAIKRMIYQGRGDRVRALFDRQNLPRHEQKIRNIIKKNKLWMR